MKTRKLARSEHGPRHITPAGRSVMRDISSAEEAIEVEIRMTLFRGLERWLSSAEMTQTDAAKILGTTQARVSDLKRGKISQFSVDLLIRLAARAGLHPKARLAA